MQNQDAAPSRIWVISELYYPEETSTGYYLTQIAEGLATRAQTPVHVLCGRPNYSAKGQSVLRTETHHGVKIRRCWGTTWNKDRLLLRLVNLLTLSVTMFVQAVLRFRRGESVLVVTNPPLLPFVISLACKLRGSRCVLLIHDVYPDVAVASGLLRHSSFAARWMQAAVKWLYRSVDSIIVLGRDMRDLVLQKLPAGNFDLQIIPNWADTDFVRPHSGEKRIIRELGLSGKFVLQYSGNMGRSHHLEAVVECAERLRDRDDIHFLMVGSGAKKAWLKKTAAERNLHNMTVADRFPRKDLPGLLTAGDVALIPFVAGMAGVSVPSRLYNVLAAGKPIIALADANSELALVIREEDAGWVIPPDDANGFEQAIREAASQQERLDLMGKNARRAAESTYQFATILDAYSHVVLGAPMTALESSPHKDHRRAA